jgi:hypothetical protein
VQRSREHTSTTCHPEAAESAGEAADSQRRISALPDDSTRPQISVLRADLRSAAVDVAVTLPGRGMEDGRLARPAPVPCTAARTRRDWKGHGFSHATTTPISIQAPQGQGVASHTAKRTRTQPAPQAMRERAEKTQALTGATDRFDDTIDEDAEAAWQEEILSCIEEVRSGKVKTTPWKDVRQKGRALLHGD